MVSDREQHRGLANDLEVKQVTAFRGKESRGAGTWDRTFYDG